MKNAFKAIMPLAPDEFDHAFDEATIVLDTNVLLDLYRYSRRSSESFLGLLSGAAQQLWMPHQAGLEFLRNRPAIRSSATKAHGERIEDLQKLSNRFTNGPERSHVSHDDAEKRFLKSLDKYLNYLEKERTELRQWAQNPAKDSVLDRLNALYDGRTQNQPSEAWYEEHRKTGAERYKRKIPPGYEDAKKEDDSKYGDYFLWAQCLEEGRSRQQPLVLVTGDLKADWWFRPTSGDRFGPRVELRQEYYDATGQLLLMFDTRQFFHRLRQRQIDGGDTQDLQDAENEIAAVQSEGEQRAKLVRDVAALSQQTSGALNLQALGVLDNQQLSEIRQWILRQNNTLRPLENYWASVGLSPEMHQLMQASFRTSVGDVARRVGSNPFAAPQPAGTDESTSPDDEPGPQEDE